MKKSIKVFLFIFAFLLFIDSLSSNAQPAPIPCKPFIFCPGGCLADGETCWDIDDPVPLDNGLLILVAGAMAFGLYKLNSRRQV